MQADRRATMSWSTVIGWVCGVLFVASLWSGASSGAVFWMGVVTLQILVVGGTFTLVRWITRQVDSRWG